MGLDYLNKKVWHPGSMKNIQKVWEVEQQQKEINKRARERAKKLLEEQHNDELKRIQVEAGLIPRSHLDRMEWMYDWGNKINQSKTNEEFLTGKKEATPGDNKQQKHVFQEEITNGKCEDFQLLHEDPMFEIVKHEKSRRDAIVNNPIEMRNIIKEVQKEYLPQDLEERRQQYRSSHRRRPSTSSSRSSSSDEERKRKQRKQKSKHSHRRQRSPSSSVSRERSRDKKASDLKSQSQKKSSFKQSKVYQTYLKDRFGGILKKDEDGNLNPDYGAHKKRYQTQHQIDEEERKRMTEKLRENAHKLQALRQGSSKLERKEEGEPVFEEGLAKIRGELLGTVKGNRNHKRYKKGSDSE